MVLGDDNGVENSKQADPLLVKGESDNSVSKTNQSLRSEPIGCY